MSAKNAVCGGLAVSGAVPTGEQKTKAGTDWPESVPGASCLPVRGTDRAAPGNGYGEAEGDCSVCRAGKIKF